MKTRRRENEVGQCRNVAHDCFRGECECYLPIANSDIAQSRRDCVMPRIAIESAPVENAVDNSEGCVAHS